MNTSKFLFRVILLNIPINGLILTMYTFIGIILYSVYHDCHPENKKF